MRDPEVIKKASVCEGEFSGDAVTIDELRDEPHETCRFFPSACPVVNGGPHCIPRSAAEIARYTIKDRTTVEAELADFRRQYPFPAQGFFDPTVEDQGDAITDKDAIMERMGTWAHRVLGVQPVDIASHGREFHGIPTQRTIEEYAVLAKSVFDGTKSLWIHECGTIVAVADVIHQLRYRAMPMAGDGRVQHEDVPYCPSCQAEPAKDGSVIYIEDLEQREEEILRRMRGL
jgi:hypothetical protein